MTIAMVSVISKIPNILKELQKALPECSFHDMQEKVNCEQLQKSEIIVADYDLVGPHIYDLPNVKLMQCTWAGIDALLPHIRTNAPPPFPIIRFTGNHFGRLIGEYVVANIVNFERNIFEIRTNQSRGQWSTEGKIREHRSIYDLTIGILGLGNIGNNIAKLLNFMGANILGCGRKDSIDLTVNKHISRYYNASNLTVFLQSCDYIVNVLPNTNETKGLLDGRMLQNCKERGAVFVNVGRGSIISEESLVMAMQKNWLSGAIVDVFENEPLRKESLLWEMKNVFISPHVSGMSRAKDIAEQFRANLKLYERNLPIPGTIDFSKGY